MTQISPMFQVQLEVLMIIPMFFLVLLKFFVLLKMLITRLRAVRSGEVHPNYFKVYEQREGTILPDSVVQVSRNFSNLNEMPYLYYTVLIFYIVMSSVSSITVVLSWLYFVFRMIHSIIHLTYNNVVHRLIFFALSSLVLFLMWIMLMVSVIL